MTALAHEPLQRAAGARTAIISSPYFFWAVLALYVAAHIALRLWETPNIGKNDVQEAVAAQAWAWGYHPRNPPLHTWLLMSSYAVFGASLLAHVVLKYLLISLAFVFAFLCGKRLLSNTGMAALSALSLMLLTPFAWTVHTALTHTLLLAVMVLATLWMALRLSEQRSLLNYMLFGLALGLGFLAKYSFIFFLAPLLGAMASERELRAVLADRRMQAALAVALLVFAPHGFWMLEARFDFVHFLAEKQQSEISAGYFADVSQGLANLAVGALSYAAPLLVLLAVTWRSAGARGEAEGSPWSRALPRISFFALGILVLDVVVLRATAFEERYFTFALLTVPLALFAMLDLRRDRSARFAVFWGMGLFVVALVGLGGLAGRASLAHRTCNRCWEEMATPALVRSLQGLGFEHGTLVADHYNLAGNLRLAFPAARTYAANYVVPQPAAASGQCVLVWNARNAGDRLPPLIEDFLAARGLTPPRGAARFVEAPLRRSRDRIDRFGYWVVEGANGDCRPRS
ncbi:MAG: glycosyltransferase family 39 protein [Hyphomonadaceae bacterium]|nr:glycosyltransferase family 39 protein [Hyphomonadaceae bacterium]